MRKPEKITMLVLDASWKKNEFGPDRIVATVQFDSDDLVLRPGDKLVIERARRES